MEENKTIKCRSCGTEFPAGTAFCNECGARLDEAASPAPRQEGSMPPPRPEEGFAPPPPQPQEQEVIPAAEEKTETRREAKKREKAEKAAAKLQAKEDKKAVKKAEKAARKAERKKRNVWAIVLMVLFFAGLCFVTYCLGFEYLAEDGLKSQNDSLTTQNEELQKTVAENEKTIADHEATIAANEESFKSEQESANSQISELSDKLVGAEDKIEEFQEKLDEYEENVESYKTLIETIAEGNLGYASERLYADKGVVVIKKDDQGDEDQGADVQIFSDGKFKYECVSGESATAEAAEGEDGEELIHFAPADTGISIFKVTGKKDIIYIAVIVEE